MPRHVTHALVQLLPGLLVLVSLFCAVWGAPQLEPHVLSAGGWLEGSVRVRGQGQGGALEWSRQVLTPSLCLGGFCR